jgi:hypothetical protein
MSTVDPFAHEEDLASTYLGAPSIHPGFGRHTDWTASRMLRTASARDFNDAQARRLRILLAARTDPDLARLVVETLASSPTTTQPPVLPETTTPSETTNTPPRSANQAATRIRDAGARAWRVLSTPLLLPRSVRDPQCACGHTRRHCATHPDPTSS